MISVLKILTLSATMLCLFPQNGLAEENFQKAIRAHEIVGALFNGYTGDIFPRKISEEQRASILRRPFLAEYILREKGFPKYDVVYKWQQKEIAVGYSWPTDPLFKGKNPAVDEDMKYYARLKPVILRKIDEINQAGVVHLKFIEPSEEKSDFAPVRIVGFKWKDYVRFSGNDIDNIGGGHEHFSQSASWASDMAVQYKMRFTNWNQNHVEGYVVPNADNTIGRAACFIKADSSDAMLESYVSECLFRSLGFVGFSYSGGSYSPGILVRRKKPDDAISIDDGDIELLKMLYGGVIQAGDDKNNVIAKLQKN